MLDTDDAALRELANRDWNPGFDGKSLPGRIQTMRNAQDMRMALKLAAELLGMDRAGLTYAVREMRKTAADSRRERAMIEALEATMEWAQVQHAILSEARDRLKVADARLELVRRDCGDE